LFPLVFGDDFGDLPKFLDRVLPERETPGPAGGQTAGTTRLPPALPASVTCYLQRLADENEHLSLLGLGRSLQIELPISTAYVPLRTTLARSLELHETERYRSGRAEHEEDVELSDVFRKAEELGLRGVVLLGEPGSGKTTGARQTTWRLASRQCLPEDLGLPPRMTPVFLRFRHLRADMLQAADGLREFLIAETYCRYAPDDRQSPGPELWNGQAGGLLWILDGLDEVIDPRARATVSTWIQQALQHRPADRFLVTCRFQGYFRPDVPLGPKFVEFHVRPLDDDQVRHFVHAWFDAAYRRLHGPGPLAADRARAASEELLEILARAEFQAGHIRELCTNPLLLTILCIVFHEERKLPTGRAELYAHCVRVLLEDWRRDVYQAGLSTKLQAYDAEAAQSVLAGIAWWMHQQQDRTAAPLDQLAEQAALGLAQLSPGTGLGRDGAGFLLRMRDEAGILALEGEGRCGFLHLSFQEFLAADHAAREGLARELAALAAKTDGSWWREVALLSLRRSRPFCEAFFREMLAAGVAEDHPDLAERCLTESLYFVPEPFVEALQQPAPADEAGQPRHQARVAAILRLLRERVDQVPELAEISRQYAESADRQTRGFAAEILARRSGAPESAMRDKEVYVHPRTGIALVTIPAGRFLMGSEQGDSDERPVHEVRIPRDFLMGKYPVTNAQYARFLEAAGGSVSKPEFWDNRRFNQPEQPVVGVSWDEARKFCEWAGGRLPSEAEWEYACRAETTTEYSFGDDPAQLGEYGWFSDNSGGQTQPVGTKQPNPWGLFDMHGNVWEWCEDGWHDSYREAPSDAAAWTAEGSCRVVRGGGWGPLPATAAVRTAQRRPGLPRPLPRLPAGSGLQVQGGRRSVLLSRPGGVRAARAGTAA
jgi:formylglycine-generating enzyme required for sulfatase activity